MNNSTKPTLLAVLATSLIASCASNVVIEQDDTIIVTKLIESKERVYQQHIRNGVVVAPSNNWLYGTGENFKAGEKAQAQSVASGDLVKESTKQVVETKAPVAEGRDYFEIFEADMREIFYINASSNKLTQESFERIVYLAPRAIAFRDIRILFNASNELHAQTIADELERVGIKSQHIELAVSEEVLANEVQVDFTKSMTVSALKLPGNTKELSKDKIESIPDSEQIEWVRIIASRFEDKGYNRAIEAKHLLISKGVPESKIHLLHRQHGQSGTDVLIYSIESNSNE